MKNLKNILIALFVLSALLFASAAEAQIPDKIMVSLKTGNAKVLSEYFNSNVELVVLENDNVYSKAQAQQIITGFFEANTPQSFKVIHQGGKEGAKYVIGILTTNKGNFRVYFLLKGEEENVLIHQLRIEKQ